MLRSIRPKRARVPAMLTLWEVPSEARGDRHRPETSQAFNAITAYAVPAAVANSAAAQLPTTVRLRLPVLVNLLKWPSPVST